MRNIDWQQAGQALHDVRYAADTLGERAAELRRATEVIETLRSALYERDEYINHLEGRLSVLRAEPVSVLGALAQLERDGVSVLSVKANAAGLVHTVVLHWPGDDSPTEHCRFPPETSDVDWVEELRERRT